MDQEQLLADVNLGRTAHVFMQWMRPVFEEVERDLIQQLKNHYRLGTCTEVVLACHAAQLVALDDLKTKIRGIAIRGDSAAREINQGDE